MLPSNSNNYSFHNQFNNKFIIIIFDFIKLVSEINSLNMRSSYLLKIIKLITFIKKKIYYDTHRSISIIPIKKTLNIR